MKIVNSSSKIKNEYQFIKRINEGMGGNHGTGLVYVMKLFNRYTENGSCPFEEDELEALELVSYEIEAITNLVRRRREAKGHEFKEKKAQSVQSLIGYRCSNCGEVYDRQKECDMCGGETERIDVIQELNEFYTRRLKEDKFKFKLDEYYERRTNEE